MGCSCSVLVKDPLDQLPESFQDIDGTRFAEVLRRGYMAVVKASYFKTCLEQGEPFQDRSNIPPEFLYTGEEVVENWKKYGNMFLMILSYCWLSEAHPDPDLFHLKRLVPFLDNMRKAYTRECSRTYVTPEQELPEFGIIVDFCSLWQNRSKVGEDSRSKCQKKEFDVGLKCIDTPYAHRDVMAIKLTGTPATELRTYILRGWTLFESDVIDGKGAGVIPALNNWKCHNSDFHEADFGSLNVVVVGDDVVPVDEPRITISTMQHWGSSRSAPCPPAQFCRDLQKRKANAEELKQRLFTSGSDQKFITHKYEATYQMMTETAVWNCSSLGVDDAYCKGLAAVLVDFRMQTLNLRDNKFGAEGLAALCEALKDNKTITEVDLSSNKINLAGAALLAKSLAVNAAITNITLSESHLCPKGAVEVAKALETNAAITTIDLRTNSIGPEGAAALAKALQGNVTITSIELFHNSIGPEGASALAKALEINRSIKHLGLGGNDIRDEGVIAFSKALGVNRTIENLDLKFSKEGAEGRASLAPFRHVAAL